MDKLAGVIDELLGQLAAARDLPADGAPAEIIASSLDQMRLLVGIEEQLDVMLDVGDELPFDLSDRESLVASVRTLLSESGVAL